VQVLDLVQLVSKGLTLQVGQPAEESSVDRTGKNSPTRNRLVTLLFVDDVAAALSDPVRRDILESLRDRPLPAGEICSLFPISRPAVSRHLRVLRDSGLVTAEVVGRQRIYTLNPKALTPLMSWLAGLATPVRWEAHLDALETEVHRTRREHRTDPTTREATTA
jgi:DNA-binding transcriptional ArsR family regulator